MGERPAIGDTRDLRAHTRDFGKRLDDKVAGDAAAIAGAGAQIGERREVFANPIGYSLPAVRVGKRQAAQFLFDGFCALGNAGHAAERDPRIADAATIYTQTQSREHRGNILVETLGDLVGAEMRARSKFWDQQAAHVFTRLTILLAVVEKEFFQR